MKITSENQLFKRQGILFYSKYFSPCLLGPVALDLWWHSISPCDLEQEAYSPQDPRNKGGEGLGPIQPLQGHSPSQPNFLPLGATF